MNRAAAANLHKHILNELVSRYDTPVMSNTYRADYVECLVKFALGDEWRLHEDWASWDCEHESGARVEIKQSAARQPVDGVGPARRRNPTFDIAGRTGYWLPPLWSRWIPFSEGRKSRLSDIYVFAWHEEQGYGCADQRDPEQWCFFVISERKLPAVKQDKKTQSIGLNALRELCRPCHLPDLKQKIREALPARDELKACTIRGIPG